MGRIFGVIICQKTPVFALKCLPFVTLCVAVSCSLGAWYNVTSATCEFCPAGTYQDSEGQTSCQRCPHQLNGVGTEGAKSIAECGGAYLLYASLTYLLTYLQRNSEKQF